jgi:transcriptional regulator with XRE-family HTH domain
MKLDPAKRLGNNIRKIRLKKGISQGDICRKLGVDRSYISNIEAGKKNLTLATIERVADALSVRSSELLK